MNLLTIANRNRRPDSCDYPLSCENSYSTTGAPALYFAQYHPRRFCSMLSKCGNGGNNTTPSWGNLCFYCFTPRKRPKWQTLWTFSAEKNRLLLSAQPRGCGFLPKQP